MLRTRLLMLVAPGAVLLVVLVLGELVLRLRELPETVQQATYARDTANPGLYRLDDLAGYVMVPKLPRPPAQRRLRPDVRNQQPRSAWP